MSDIVVNAPSPLAGMGLFELLSERAYATELGGDGYEVRVQVGSGALAPVLRSVDAWASGYAIDVVELRVDSRLYRLVPRDARPASTELDLALPSELELELDI